MWDKEGILNARDDRLSYYLFRDVSKYNNVPCLLRSCLFDSSFGHTVFESEEDLNEVLDFLRVHGRLLES